MYIPKLKHIIPEIKNFAHGFIRFDTTNDRINKLEKKSIKNTQNEIYPQRKRKGEKKVGM